MFLGDSLDILFRLVTVEMAPSEPVWHLDVQERISA